MAYERMSPKIFDENLKSGKYASATAARRGLGKCAFGPHDKNIAQAAIDTHFSGTTAPRTARKTTTAKKTAATKAAVPVKAAPVAKRAYTRRTPVVPTAVPASPAPTVSAPAEFAVPVLPRTLVGEEVLRQHNLMLVVSTFGNHTTRTSAEQELYDLAVAASTQSLKGAAPQPPKQPPSFRDQFPVPGQLPTMSPEKQALTDIAARAAANLVGPEFGKTMGYVAADHGG